MTLVSMMFGLKNPGFKTGVFFFFIFPLTASAWDKHQSLMPQIRNSFPPSLQQALNQTAVIPCESEDIATLQRLADELQINPDNQVLPTAHSGEKCGEGTRTLLDLIATSVDDPDQGIDRNLSDSPGNLFDPKNERKWMGGTQGPSSQGFRHMYFGGWDISHPLTFQFPLRAIGQAPFRAEIIAQKAKTLLKAGQLTWGSRLVGWAMHYIQDLSQPFHTTQLLTLRMVPWYQLFSWPLGDAFQSLVQDTTRVVTNFHWAYEGYTLNRIQLGEDSPFKDCLAKPENYSKLSFDPKNQSPTQLALQVREASLNLASDLGRSEIQFFGGQLLQRGVDFTANTQMLSYPDYSIRPDLDEPRKLLHQVTCQALANASMATRFLLEWAFQP